MEKGFITMKYVLNNLCVEVTQLCNMGCAHCTRGEANNINIKTCYMDKLLDHTESIGNITFTGGEPSLNIEAIEYFLQQCKDRDIYVGSFYVVTNGKTNVLPLAIACMRWYAYCDDVDGISGLALSKDQFHDPIDPEHERLLRGLAFFKEDKFTDFNRVSLINSGRAELLGGYSKIDVETHNESFDFWGDFDDDYITVDSMVYLSANGEIRTNCDAAFDDDSFTIGSLETHTLHQILATQIVDTMEVLPF